jgi:MYXO-CTERM domain-containing protein
MYDRRQTSRICCVDLGKVVKDSANPPKRPDEGGHVGTSDDTGVHETRDAGSSEGSNDDTSVDESRADSNSGDAFNSSDDSISDAGNGSDLEATSNRSSTPPGGCHVGSGGDAPTSPVAWLAVLLAGLGVSGRRRDDAIWSSTE